MSKKSINPVHDVDQIFFSVGEPSGDAHAAALIKAFREQNQRIRLVGYGGPLMAAEGFELHCDMTRNAVMFLGRALKQIFVFRNLYKKACDYLKNNNVKAVVLVDFPGFNWWIAKAAKKLGIPVFYFMPPQLWAWGRWRTKKMQRLIDYTFVTMPFEKRWFEANSCGEVFEVGHPFLEEAKHVKADERFVFELKSKDTPILTILPGSRDQEVENNLNDMLNAVAHVRLGNPNVRPVIAAFKQSQADLINQKLAEKNMAIPVYVGKTQELIRAAHFAFTVSGSVTMELLAQHVPTVVYYRINKWGHFAQRFFRRVRYITLVNLLEVDISTPNGIYYDNRERIIPAYPNRLDCDNMLFPEFLTSFDQSAEVAEIFLRWMACPSEYEHCKQLLKRLHDKLDPVENPFQVVSRTILDRIAVRQAKPIDRANIFDDDENRKGDDITEAETAFVVNLDSVTN